MLTISERTKVFVPDDNFVWTTGEIIKEINGSTFEVEIDDSEYLNSSKLPKIRIVSLKALSRPLESLPLQNDITEFGVEDMTTLNYLHEASILDNLRRRFFCQRPYTYTGDICIAVNPYQWLDIYSAELRDKYLNTPRNEMIPHAYATSASAYKGLRDHNRNQSILVSGESGAGKTETVKILMGHLAQVSSSKERNDTTIVKVLKANPLLESFGNAKTVRNDNSSRFGKFTQLQFDQHSKLVGSRCVTYLLEKTRVVSQSDEHERNYHIFHELFAAPEDVKTSLHISSLSCRDFMYTCQGDTRTDTIEGVTDGARFLTTMTTLGLIGVSEEEQRHIQRIVAGLVYLGQVSFVCVDADTSEIDPAVSEETIQRCCSLLGLDTTAFKERMIVRNIDAAGDTLLVALSREQATDGRDALAKDTYTRLFLWLVSIINESTAASEADTQRNRIIGLLDIFGFESFRVNRFEQLCINYTNEKLQAKFTSDVLMSVQAEYREEGLAWETIDYKDNNDVLELLESRLGFIALLNEECLLPKGSNANFLNKITNAYNKNPLFSLSVQLSRDEFCIQHYAGKVCYNVTGFIERNKDALPAEMRTLMLTSNNELIAHIFAPLHAGSDLPEALAPRRRPSSDSSVHSGPHSDLHSSSAPTLTRKASIGGNMHGSAGAAASSNRRQSFMKADTVFTKFKSQLTSLMESISFTDVNYVRCIKPNSNKDRTEYNRSMVVEQLRCAGIIEAVKVSRAAYPYRISHYEFMARFRCLRPSSWWRQHGADQHVPVDGNHLQMKSLRKQQCQLLLGAFADAFRALPFKKSGGSAKAVDRKHFELGRGKVFFSDGVLEVVERERGGVLGSRAVCIQRKVRTARQRHRFLYVRACAVYIQAFFRCQSVRRQYLEFLAAVRCIQCHVRRLLAMQLLKRMRRTYHATRIQSAYRRHNRQSRYIRARRGCTVMSSIVRMVLQRFKFVKLRDEARESAKLSNQLEQLKQRLVFEQHQRSLLEAAMLQQREESAAFLAAQLLNHRHGVMEHQLNVRSELEERLALENEALRNQLASLITNSAAANISSTTDSAVDTINIPVATNLSQVLPALVFSKSQPEMVVTESHAAAVLPSKNTFTEQQAISSAELAALENLQAELSKHRLANELLEGETHELRRELKKAYNYLDIKSGEVAYAKVMLEVAERERDVFRIDKDKNSRLVMQYRVEKKQLMDTMIAQSAELDGVRQQLYDANARYNSEALRRDTLKVGLMALMNSSSSASFYSSDHASQDALQAEIRSVFEQEEELFQAAHATSDHYDDHNACATSQCGKGGISRIMSKSAALTNSRQFSSPDARMEAVSHNNSNSQVFSPSSLGGGNRAASNSIDEESVYSVHSSTNLNLNNAVMGSGGTVSALPRRRRRQTGGGASVSSLNLRGSPSADHDSVISSISTHRSPREVTPRGADKSSEQSRRRSALETRQQPSASGSAHSNGDRRDVFELHTNSVMAAAASTTPTGSNRSTSRRSGSSRHDDGRRSESIRHSSSSSRPHHSSNSHQLVRDPQNISADIDFEDIYPSMSRVNTIAVAATDDLAAASSSSSRRGDERRGSSGDGTLRDALGREIASQTRNKHSRASSRSSNHSSSANYEGRGLSTPINGERRRDGSAVSSPRESTTTVNKAKTRDDRPTGPERQRQPRSKTQHDEHSKTPTKDLTTTTTSVSPLSEAHLRHGVLVGGVEELPVLTVPAEEESAIVNIFSSNFWSNLF